MNIPMTDTLHTIFAAVSFVVGTMIGSFLNVCVYRLPRGESIVRPRSKCPKCGNPIAWHDNLPLVSWLALGAKCRNCGEPISWQYPLVEALTGVLFLLVYLRFGVTLATPVYMALAASMVLVTFVDLTDWTIPNEVTLPGMPIGLGCAVLGMLYPESGLLLQDPIAGIIGLFLGGGVLYALDKLSMLALGKRGMGFGDVKLLAMLGAFFGWQGVIVILVAASFVGSGVGITMIMATRSKTDRSEGHYLPFGPYLALGGVIYLFVGPEIIRTYLDYLQTPIALALP